jgi:muconolactone delta-isomerase
MLRFHVSAAEFETRTKEEADAIIKHRVKSIEYFKNLQEKGVTEFVFKSECMKETYLVINANSLEEADVLLKRDPLFPYSRLIVTPVTTTAEMVEEAQDYLGEEILTSFEIAHLVPPPVKIDDRKTYIQATKALAAFNPLVSEEEYKEILRKTLRSQRLHADEKEIADYNPVGVPDGYLYLQISSVEEAREHVAKAEIYPYTVVNFRKLLTLNQTLKKLGENIGTIAP